jgi:enterochelin esterase-like enzyme
MRVKELDRMQFTCAQGSDYGIVDIENMGNVVRFNIIFGASTMKSSLKSLPHILLLLFALASVTGTMSAQTQSSDVNSSKGSLERIKVFGASLEGNLEGDSPERDVVVYLPPSYSSEPDRRYPVVYFLHGYSVGVEAYVNMLKLPDMADNAIAAGAREMILVLPDALTVYSGSMYSNSPTTGDWEGYISKDLIEYIDSHYRTMADRNSRGLSGHSMGGYGTVRIGMKHPEVFSALYAMSSCCLMNNPVPAAPASKGARGQAKSPSPPPAKSSTQRGPAAKARGRTGGGFGNVLFAQAAAWAPNPMNPPQYFDLPTKDGQIQPLIAAKWAANSPLVMVDQYVPNLKQYSAIAMDVGDEDTLRAMNLNLHEALTRLRIDHSFEEYDGDHGNRVTERFQNNLMPFFSQQLKFP